MASKKSLPQTAMAVRDPHRVVRYHGRLGFTSQQRELLDILRDLAHDLDYFEADPSLRAEDNSFFDEEKLKGEIDLALNNINSLAGYRIEVKG